MAPRSASPPPSACKCCTTTPISTAACLSAYSLQVTATMGERKLGFDLADVDGGDHTIKLQDGGHGLKTGDEVIYDKGSAAVAIGGLTNNQHYFVALQADGTIKLSDSKAHAIA
ncbi:hypothetical protein LP419_39555 [Massilia sp. H-1]|nr:hypothetical protein LP419_39555 [Massilia sp. H-1]